MTRRRLLYLATKYPPEAAAGSLRTAKMIKYLAKDWEVTVVAPELDREALHTDVTSYAARVVRLPYRDPIRVLRRLVRGLLPKRRDSLGDSSILSGSGYLARLQSALLFPDNYRSWARRAVRWAVKEEPVDVVVATGPAFSAFLAGRRIAARWEVPLILDYRDSWYDNEASRAATPLHRLIHARLEKRCLLAAEAATAVSEGIADSLWRHFGQKALVIPNGFDPDDFPESVAPHAGDRLHLIHAGGLYGERSLRPLVLAMEGSDLASRVMLSVLGRWRMRDLAELKSAPFEVLFESQVPHGEALRRITAADVGVVALGVSPTNAEILTGKLFQYLGAGVPVLVLSSTSAAGDLCETEGIGWWRHPDDLAGIRNLLEELAGPGGDRKLAARTPHPDRLRRFTYGALAERMSAVLDAAIQTAGSQHRPKV